MEAGGQYHHHSFGRRKRAEILTMFLSHSLETDGDLQIWIFILIVIILCLLILISFFLCTVIFICVSSLLIYQTGVDYRGELRW